MDTRTRNKLIALVHMGCARCCDGPAMYEALLYKITGKTSCTQMSNEQLIQVVEHLRRFGALDARRMGGEGPNRPTEKQWAAVETLARKLGFQGLQDKGLEVFVRSVAKVDGLRFLTRRQMSQVILGLERWLDHRRTTQANKEQAL